MNERKSQCRITTDYTNNILDNNDLLYIIRSTFHNLWWTTWTI